MIRGHFDTFILFRYKGAKPRRVLGRHLLEGLSKLASDQRPLDKSGKILGAQLGKGTRPVL